MGTSHSFEELGEKLGRYAERIVETDKRGAELAGELVRGIVLAEESSASGGDLVLSRVNDGKGAKIGAVTKTVADGVIVKATGPVQLVENRLHPHLIGPRGVGVQKGGRRSRAGRLKAVDQGTAVYGKSDVLHFGDTFARYVAHPGVAVGKHPWAKGIASAEPKILPVFQKEHAATLLSVFH